MNRDHDSTHERRPAAATFIDRICTEAQSLHQGRVDDQVDDVSAIKAARESTRNPELQLIQRFKALPTSADYLSAFKRIRGVLGGLCVIGVLLAIACGYGAAKGSLSPDGTRPINIFWLVGGVLGGQTLLLLLWVILMLPGPGISSRFSIGGMLLGSWRWVAARTMVVPGRSTAESTTIEAYSRRTMTGSLGRWRLATISNGFWLLFDISLLVTTVVLLGVRQYDFAWETTILSPETYVRITEIIAWLPSMFGFLVPTLEQIQQAQFDPANPGGFPGADAEARSAWSSFLIGSIILYGIMPRLLLTAASLGKVRASTRGFRLDLDQPSIARIRGRLDPDSRRIGIIRNESDEAEIAAAHAAAAEQRRLAHPAVVGLEMEVPSTGWPPTVGAEVEDLGIVESGQQRRELIEALRNRSSEPSRVLMFCSLLTTPDRGVGRFLTDLVGSLSVPVGLILTEGDSLRQRSEHASVSQRIADWRSLSEECGVEKEMVAEIDLDHLTANSSGRLHALLGGRDDQSRPAGKLEDAFDLIVERARTWSIAPPEAERAALQRGIASIYADQREEWAKFLRIDARMEQDPAATLRKAAERVQDLLPSGIRLDPKWAAAGLAAGALGCIAVAALITPTAISALPMWSVIAGSLGGLLKSLKPEDADRDEEDMMDISDAVQSAALFAILLEFQGLGEDRIEQKLLDALRPGEPGVIHGAGQARLWLDEVLKRLESSGNDREGDRDD